MPLHVTYAWGRESVRAALQSAATSAVPGVLQLATESADLHGDFSVYLLGIDKKNEKASMGRVNATLGNTLLPGGNHICSLGRRRVSERVCDPPDCVNNFETPR